MDYEGELSIPAVARYGRLPQRLFLRPEFDLPTADTYFPDKYLPRFLQIMRDDYDNELKYDVARSLERIILEELAPADNILPVVRTVLDETDDLNVRRACAMVLLAADSKEDADRLAEICRAGDLQASLLIEPELASWKSDVLQSEWMDRIKEPQKFPRQLVCLACEGLTELAAAESAPILAQLAQQDTTRFQVRQAAAAATARIDAKAAFDVAQELANGTLKDRLTAVQLLNTASSDEALNVLSKLCDDSKGSVAALAWQTLFRQDPQRLTDRLETGSRHPEANVRHAVVQVAEELPTGERCDLLNEVLADRNLYVRNHARETLTRLTTAAPDLNDRILANAGDVTAKPDAPWEQLEQAMVLLGVKRHDAYQPNCIELMKHERPEVYVTSAWLLHLMPRTELSPPAVQQAKATWERLQNPKLPQPEVESLGLQLGCLFHVAGFCKDNDLRAICELQFSKDVPTTVDSRAAAMWALGMLAEGSQDSDLQSKFVARIFDDDPQNPEAFEVRAGAALALGLLGSKSAVSDLRTALGKYGYGSELSRASATALVQLGEDRPEFPEIPPVPLGEWPIRFPTR
jgi:HEAT repeat protein